MIELEALRGWAATGPERAPYVGREPLVFAMGPALGPAHHGEVTGPSPGTLADAAGVCAEVLYHAHEHGMCSAARSQTPAKASAASSSVPV